MASWSPKRLEKQTFNTDWMFHKSDAKLMKLEDHIGEYEAHRDVASAHARQLAETHRKNRDFMTAGAEIFAEGGNNTARRDDSIKSGERKG